VPVPIECKPAPLVPAMSHVPQHEVAVDLMEAVAGIKNRGGIDKNLRKNISSNINLKYESCRYVHAE